MFLSPAPLYDGGGSVTPQARFAGALFAPSCLVAGQERLEQSAYVRLLGLVQEHGRLKQQTHGFVGRHPRLFAEDQSVQRSLTGRRPSAEGPQGGLGRPRLVAAKLGDVHPGALGEADLGEAGLAAQEGQAFPKLHPSDRSRPLRRY